MINLQHKEKYMMNLILMLQSPVKKGRIVMIIIMIFYIIILIHVKKLLFCPWYLNSRGLITYAKKLEWMSVT